MKTAPFTYELNTEKEPTIKEETEQLCDLNKASLLYLQWCGRRYEQVEQVCIFYLGKWRS